MKTSLHRGPGRPPLVNKILKHTIAVRLTPEMKERVREYAYTHKFYKGATELINLAINEFFERHKD
jgi:hypothetical protein